MFMSSAIRKFTSSSLVPTVKKAYPILICKGCPLYNQMDAVFSNFSCGMCEMLQTPEWSKDHIAPRESMGNFLLHKKTKKENK